MQGDRKVKCARYSNNGEVSAAIVAVITEGVDWACYFGVSKHVWRKQDGVDAVAETGDKMSKEDGQHFFPYITEPYREY